MTCVVFSSEICYSKKEFCSIGPSTGHFVGLISIACDAFYRAICYSKKEFFSIGPSSGYFVGLI